MNAAVLHVYIPLNRRYARTVGLSERIIRGRLRSAGWTVWRGGCIGMEWNRYPSVKKKYDALLALLAITHPHHLEHLQYLSAVHHGMPDFLCHRNGEFKFVECKFMYEQLSSRQQQTIKQLIWMGFAVEVHKIVSKQTLVRRAIIDLDDGSKEKLEIQKKISFFTRKKSLVKRTAPNTRNGFMVTKE